MSQQPSDKRQRIIAIILTAAILILGYITLKQNNQVTDLEAEKTILITQLEDYKRDLLSQTTANDSLNVFIGQETTRLNEKIEEIEALGAITTNQLRRVRGEVFSLRKQVESLTKNVDSVNTAYAALSVVADSLSSDLTLSSEANSNLTSENAQLGRTVNKGAALQLAFFEAGSYRVNKSGKEKLSSNASRVNRVKGCFTIAKNAIAKAGSREVFLRISSSDNRVLTAGKDAVMVVNGESIRYASKANVPFDGESTKGCLTYDVPVDLSAGSYTLALYIDGVKVGETAMILN
ncbi:MAG: hypothetical protein GWO80_05635 [Bacteroidetes bacterium]|nr:hypothetical protein [Bacteroidota bacterium]